jgi:hypothetical protein
VVVLERLLHRAHAVLRGYALDRDDRRAVGHPRFNGDNDLYGIFDDDPQYRSLTAGGIVPLGDSGLAFNLEGTLTQTTPESSLGIQTASRFERLSARLDYPLVGGGAVVAAVLFVLVERRASEPIIPLALFRDRDFVLASAVGVTVGIAMFAAVAYLPTFLQMVGGVSATESGLLMLPIIAGMLFLLGERRWYILLGCSVAPVVLLYLLSVYLMRVGVV